jgi:cytochrome c-type protein NapB
MKHVVLLFILLSANVLRAEAAASEKNKSEAESFRRQDVVDERPFPFVKKSERRSLDVFYSRRAFLGAPPYIPHEVGSDMSQDFGSCLTCHQRGGYVQKFKAYAPLTPHPEHRNCRQCHVSQLNSSLFRETAWLPLVPPKLKRVGVVGGPPPMPHPLDMRENCSACHTGPAALSEIVSPHQQRSYCRQCHGTQTASVEPFDRGGVQ